MDKQENNETYRQAEFNGNGIPATNSLQVFTPREHQTMELIAAGLSSKLIGQELGISEDTVESHRKNILKKLGVVNMNQALAYAFRNNLIK